jgi:hypothetical protein
MTQDLRAELLRRAERDQAARQSLDADAFSAVDAENLPWFRQVVAGTGWPGRPAVGEDGAHAAWLLVQHADSDPAFQRECLDLLTAAAAHGEATLRQVAYLTDRVLLAEGQPQEFGTQVMARNGAWVPCSLRAPASVDQRREAMGLGPMAEYLASIEARYGPAEPPVIPCPSCGNDVEVTLPDVGEESQAQCAECGQTLRLSPAGRRRR